MKQGLFILWIMLTISFASHAKISCYWEYMSSDGLWTTQNWAAKELPSSAKLNVHALLGTTLEVTFESLPQAELNWTDKLPATKQQSIQYLGCEVNPEIQELLSHLNQHQAAQMIQFQFAVCSFSLHAPLSRSTNKALQQMPEEYSLRVDHSSKKAIISAFARNKIELPLAASFIAKKFPELELDWTSCQGKTLLH